MMSARDRQVSGGHYLGKMQPFGFAMSNEYNYFQAHALAYLHRYSKKGQAIDDLRKIIHLCEMEIERLGEKP